LQRKLVIVAWSTERAFCAIAAERRAISMPIYVRPVPAVG